MKNRGRATVKLGLIFRPAALFRVRIRVIMYT